jgi:hypothetical protein
VIYVGLDDTDTLESPGTVQLARHLVVQLASQWRGVLIIRHQLLIDPRVPCTRKNGCVAIGFEPLSKQSVDSFADDVCRTTVDWCPVGSDPGVCVVADQASPDIVEFGKACQSQLVSQTQARSLAARPWDWPARPMMVGLCTSGKLQWITTTFPEFLEPMNCGGLA